MPNLVIPRPVIEKVETLCNLADQYPGNIPVPIAASFMEMDAESLRCSMEQNRCPFGFSWQKDARGYRGFKIPTPTLFFWYTQLNPFKAK